MPFCSVKTRSTSTYEEENEKTRLVPDYTEQPRAAGYQYAEGNTGPKVHERGRWGPQVSLVEILWPVSRGDAETRVELRRRSSVIVNQPRRGSKRLHPDSLDSIPHDTNVIALHSATMGDAAVPQFLTAVADALENISVPVLTLGTFTLGIFLHFIFGLLSKLSGSKKKKRKKGVAKKVN